jgi:hypothetical protein
MALGSWMRFMRVLILKSMKLKKILKKAKGNAGGF